MLAGGRIATLCKGVAAGGNKPAALDSLFARLREADLGIRTETHCGPLCADLPHEDPRFGPAKADLKIKAAATYPLEGWLGETAGLSFMALVLAVVTLVVLATTFNDALS